MSGELRSTMEERAADLEQWDVDVASVIQTGRRRLRRRRTAIIGTAAALVLAVGLGSLTGWRVPFTPAPSDHHEVLGSAWVYYVDEGEKAVQGISVSGKWNPEVEGTTLGNGTVTMAGRSAPAYVRPWNWDYGVSGPPKPRQPLRPGHPMAVEATVLPLCDGRTHAPPSIALPYSTSDGQTKTLHIAIAAQGMSVAQTQAYVDHATRQFCSHDVLVYSNPIVNPETGRDYARYWWMNPGGSTVTVRSQGWRGPHGFRWLATKPHEVPADGHLHKLIIVGVHMSCDQPPPPPLTLGTFVVTHPDGTKEIIKEHESSVNYRC